MSIKKAALEQEWWGKFYQHLVKTVSFIFPDTLPMHDNVDMVPRLEPNNYSSGIDGNKIFFSFYVWRKGHQYRCGINLEFAESLIRSKMNWQFSNLQTLQTDNIGIVKSSWSVIRDFHKPKDSDPVGHGYFLPKDSTPYNLINAIKNAILKDGEDDGNDDMPPAGPKPPGNKMPKPVSQPKKAPVLPTNMPAMAF